MIFRLTHPQSQWRLSICRDRSPLLSSAAHVELIRMISRYASSHRQGTPQCKMLWTSRQCLNSIFSSLVTFLSFGNLDTRYPQLTVSRSTSRRRCDKLTLHVYEDHYATNSTAGEDHPDARHGSSRAEGPVLSASLDA